MLKNICITTVVGTLAIAAAHAGTTTTSTLLTSAGGYTGPALTFLASQNADYIYTNGPTLLGGLISFTSTTDFGGSSIGHGNVATDAYYGLADNGRAQNVVTIGLEGGDFATSFMTLTFDTPVQSFGALMNYARFSDGKVHPDPVISAYDSANMLIASYDLATLAPIVTPGATDQFAFRGIQSSGSLIKSFRLEGSAIIATGAVLDAVPEPATWTLMIAGFGLVGATMRRRSPGRLPAQA